MRDTLLTSLCRMLVRIWWDIVNVKMCDKLGARDLSKISCHKMQTLRVFLVLALVVTSFIIIGKIKNNRLEEKRERFRPMFKESLDHPLPQNNIIRHKLPAFVSPCLSSHWKNGLRLDFFIQTIVHFVVYVGAYWAVTFLRGKYLSLFGWKT